jgi:hypothetical protein
VTLHAPTRPTWLCTGCGAPWPCATRRQQLQADYREAHLALGLYLASCLVDAAADFPAEPAGDLYNRFLRWAVPPMGSSFSFRPI